MIEAAGGVVWRTSAKGVLKVLVVHRPRYDDWSFPKGKVEADETHRAAALREVVEETGLVCSVGRELPETRYRDRKGRTKRVRYWAMQPVDGVFVVNAEVDEIRWLRTNAVAGLLSYQRDLPVLAGFCDILELVRK